MEYIETQLRPGSLISMQCSIQNDTYYLITYYQFLIRE